MCRHPDPRPARLRRSTSRVHVWRPSVGRFGGVGDPPHPLETREPRWSLPSALETSRGTLETRQRYVRIAADKCTNLHVSVVVLIMPIRSINEERSWVPVDASFFVCA